MARGGVRGIPPEIYGDEVPQETALRLGRAKVTTPELDALIGVLGHHWPAIEAHVKAHLVDRRYQACQGSPAPRSNGLCDRWCPIGGDPDLIRLAESAEIFARSIEDVHLPVSRPAKTERPGSARGEG